MEEANRKKRRKKWMALSSSLESFTYKLITSFFSLFQFFFEDEDYDDSDDDDGKMQCLFCAMNDLDDFSRILRRIN